MSDRVCELQTPPSKFAEPVTSKQQEPNGPSVVARVSVPAPAAPALLAFVSALGLTM